MKPVSFVTVILSALALGASSHVNAEPSSGLREFVTDLGLSQTDVEAVVASYKGSLNKYGQVLPCKILNFLFPNNTYLPSEVAAYTTKVSINWSTRAWLNGTCVFSPPTTKATAIGVKIVNFFNTQFAVRSGGHSPDPTLASTSQGILFSLENLNQIDVDTTKNIVSIGPGNRWGNVYENLQSRGFVVVGGRVPPVGVGGLVTGGGLSYFTGTEGFAADTVKNYEVVLGDGSIVNANAKENPDLWWALKGGGNNFGIVTRFDMKAIPKPGGLIWGGNLNFLPSQYPQVIDAIVKFQAEGQITDPKAAIITSFVRFPSGAIDYVIVTVFHQDPTNSTPAALQHFFDIGPVGNTAMVRTLSSLAADTYGPAAEVPPMRQLFRDLTISANDELYQFALDLKNETWGPLDLVPGIAVSFVYQPIAVGMVDASNATGGHPLGIPRKPQVWLCLNIAWALESNDDLIISTGKTFLEKIKAKAIGMGLYDEFLYLNDASADQPVMTGYGQANLDRLRKISKKFDPKQVFQKQVTGGFKLH